MTGTNRLVLLGVIFLCQLLLVGFCYQFLRDITCDSFPRPQACYAVRDGLGRLFAAMLVFGLMIPARRQLFGFLRAGAPAGLAAVAALGGLAAGLALMLAPLLWQDLTTRLVPLALILSAGAGLSVTAVLLGSAPLGAWLSALRRGGPWLWLPLAVALLSPELTGLLNGAWGWPPLTAATFSMVLRVLALIPGELSFEPAEMVIGFDDFLVRVGEPCSGLQGFALITLVLAAFISLHRDRLRLPLALVLLPIGLAASFALNVIRIAMLIWIGARVSPDLAVNAFHSYAGWLLFTLLSLGLIAGAHLVPALWRSAPAPVRPAATGPSPFRRDPVSAMLVPLVVTLLSGLFAATFFADPQTAYPFRLPAMFAGLALFLPFWARLDWRTDLLPPAAGAVVGILWILVAPPVESPPPAPAFAGMGAVAAAIWIVSRGIGTVLLVPLIEEAAFRGYLLGHLFAGAGPAARVAGVLVSAAGFAFLHESGAAAFVAGLVFAAVYLRRGSLADAVWAHAAANLVVFAVAAASGHWALI